MDKKWGYLPSTWGPTVEVVASGVNSTRAHSSSTMALDRSLLCFSDLRTAGLIALTFRSGARQVRHFGAMGRARHGFSLLLISNGRIPEKAVIGA